MLGKFFECEADRNKKYFRVIQTNKEYEDGRRFPIDEIVVCDRSINLNAKERTEIGGFCITTYDYIFRWLIRGDTLCQVIISKDDKIYKTISENGIYVSEKIILKNPRKIDDEFAMELYKKSKLPEKSFFKAMTACAICGYTKTANKVFEDKINAENADIAITELKEFCQARTKEYNEEFLKNETVKLIYDKLKEIQLNKV